MVEIFAWNGTASSLMPIQISTVETGFSHIPPGSCYIDEIAHTFTFREGMQLSPSCYTVVIAKCRHPAKEVESNGSMPVNTAHHSDEFFTGHEHISDWSLTFNVFQSDTVSSKDTSWRHRLTTIPDRKVNDRVAISFFYL